MGGSCNVMDYSYDDSIGLEDKFESNTSPSSILYWSISTYSMASVLKCSDTCPILLPLPSYVSYAVLQNSIAGPLAPVASAST